MLLRWPRAIKDSVCGNEPSPQKAWDQEASHSNLWGESSAQPGGGALAVTLGLALSSSTLFVWTFRTQRSSASQYSNDGSLKLDVCPDSLRPPQPIPLSCESVWYFPALPVSQPKHRAWRVGIFENKSCFSHAAVVIWICHEFYEAKKMLTNIASVA